MQPFFRKPVFIVVVILLIFGAVTFFALYEKPKVAPPPAETATTPILKVIGTSVQGREIESYTYSSRQSAGGDGSSSGACTAVTNGTACFSPMSSWIIWTKILWLCLPM